jgi:class 3 adenylate cyclase
MDVAQWLQALGMEQYAPAFAQNEIGPDLLPSLTGDDLKDLGVALVGHRRRLLEGIAALRGSAAADVDPPAKRPAAEPEAERRQLTVMFCDLVGSTELASRLDPEDLRQVIVGFQRTAAEIVSRFGGFVAKLMGDGALVYFGYPQAHEDDPEQAVRAGLALIDAVGEMSAPERLRVRIGIATGVVIVGDLIGEGQAQEYGIVGEAPNLAARLQGLAGPDTIVISEGTRRQIGSFFEAADLGPQQLKGFAEPQRAWRILAENKSLSRFEALHSGSSPLVGREEEIEVLLRRWTQAKSGSGRVALISAEPGIGKSRLAEALVDRLHAEPHTRLRYFCSAHHQDSAFYPIVTHLEHACRFERGEAPEAKLAKLDALLASTAAPDGEIALLAQLMSLPSRERYPSLDFTPQRRRAQTFETMIRQVAHLAKRLPLLIVFEDIHWIDPSSCDLLDQIIERISELPVLLLATFRPEFRPPWTGQSHVTTLALTRLNRRETIALIAGMAGADALPTDVVDEIADRTDGVPLFIEELTKAVIEAGTVSKADATLSMAVRPGLGVPATLQASLMARLDRLGPAKDVAQVGAAIGRTFDYDLLAIASGGSETEVQSALARLTDAGLVFTRGTPPHATYIFKHALVQDAAYGTLLRGRRHELHARIAAALEREFPEKVDAQPELLAQHLTRAGLVDRALEYWRRAAERALRGSALAEAIAHARKGIESIASLPPDTDRARQDLRLQMILAQALLARHGHGTTESVEAYSRARALAEELGDVSVQFPALYGIWVAHYARVSREFSQVTHEVLALAEQHPTSTRLCLARRLNGSRSLLRGELLVARDQLDWRLASITPRSTRAPRFPLARISVLPH